MFQKGDFYPCILEMPLGLNIADKVAVRDQTKSKAPYDFTIQHYLYIQRQV